MMPWMMVDLRPDELDHVVAVKEAVVRRAGR